MFPDIPSGIFELRSVKRNDVTSEKSAAFEGKKIEMIVFIPFFPFNTYMYSKEFCRPTDRP